MMMVVVVTIEIAFEFEEQRRNFLQIFQNLMMKRRTKLEENERLLCLRLIQERNHNNNIIQKVL